MQSETSLSLLLPLRTSGRIICRRVIAALHTTTRCQDARLKVEFSIWLLTASPADLRFLPISLKHDIFLFDSVACVYIAEEDGSCLTWRATIIETSPVWIFPLHFLRRSFPDVAYFSAAAEVTELVEISVWAHRANRAVGKAGLQINLSASRLHWIRWNGS